MSGTSYAGRPCDVIGALAWQEKGEKSLTVLWWYRHFDNWPRARDAWEAAVKAQSMATIACATADTYAEALLWNPDNASQHMTIVLCAGSGEAPSMGACCADCAHGAPCGSGRFGALEGCESPPADMTGDALKAYAERCGNDAGKAYVRETTGINPDDFGNPPDWAAIGHDLAKEEFGVDVDPNIINADGSLNWETIAEDAGSIAAVAVCEAYGAGAAAPICSAVGKFIGGEVAKLAAALLDVANDIEGQLGFTGPPPIVCASNGPGAGVLSGVLSAYQMPEGYSSGQTDQWFDVPLNHPRDAYTRGLLALEAYASIVAHTVDALARAKGRTWWHTYQDLVGFGLAVPPGAWSLYGATPDGINPIYSAGAWGGTIDMFERDLVHLTLNAAMRAKLKDEPPFWEAGSSDAPPGYRQYDRIERFGLRYVPETCSVGLVFNLVNRDPPPSTAQWIVTVRGNANAHGIASAPAATQAVLRQTFFATLQIAVAKYRASLRGHGRAGFGLSPAFLAGAPPPPKASVARKVAIGVALGTVTLGAAAAGAVYADRRGWIKLPKSLRPTLPKGWF